MEKELSEYVKNYAQELGADLVGIAPVERWINAAPEVSPQGVLPGSKAVIACGFHYLDSCVELGGNDDPRIAGPAASNHISSEHGNYTAFKIAKFLQGKGFESLMVPSTIWWQYRATDTSPRGFKPDLSHFYAAPAAGLGELGWNNLCLTPEYGPRQRFVSIITKAPLVPDPMYKGPPLCDKCMQCAKKCPMQTFDKEVNGMIEMDYGDRKFSFPNRNLWRCSAGENFQLDVYAPWPEKINEQTIEEFSKMAIEEHPEWRFQWKMGMCLKYCMPPARRYYDPSFTKSPRRKRDVTPLINDEEIAKTQNALISMASKIEADYIGIIPVTQIIDKGIDTSKILPTLKSFILVGQSYPKNCMADTGISSKRNALRMAKFLQDKQGYDTLVETGLNPDILLKAAGFDKGSREWKIEVIAVSVPFTQIFNWYSKDMKYKLPPEELTMEKFTENLHKLALQSGADLFGVASAERLDSIHDQLSTYFNEIDYFTAVEQGWGKNAIEFADLKGKPHNPILIEQKLQFKRPCDYMQQAKSVIVLGLSLLNASVDNAGKPPAFKAAHYAATVHKECHYQLAELGLKIAKMLAINGYKAHITVDIEDLASIVYSNMQSGLRANRFAAVAAGLGELGWNGMVLTPEFGPRQRFIAVVTDAPLISNKLYRGKPLCCNCKKCVSSCSVSAIEEEKALTFKVEGKTFTSGEIKLMHCDWAARYALAGEEGPRYMGSSNDFYPPEVITREDLLDTIKKSDKFQRSNYCPIVERCMTECTFRGTQGEKTL